MWKKFWATDSIQFGAILGLVTPAVMYLLFDAIDRTILEVSLNNGVKLLRANIIPDDTQFALAVGGNLIFFYTFMVRRMKDKTGRGILMSTFLYAFTYILLFFMLNVTQIKILSP